MLGWGKTQVGSPALVEVPAAAAVTAAVGSAPQRLNNLAPAGPVLWGPVQGALSPAPGSGRAGWAVVGGAGGCD